MMNNTETAEGLSDPARAGECANDDCRQHLSAPLLLCSRCKGAAYCSKLCQVPLSEPERGKKNLK